jgi:hypothetical protein
MKNGFNNLPGFLSVQNSDEPAVNLVPTLNHGRLAVVDLATIQRLAMLLPKANLEQIKVALVIPINRADNMEAFVSILEEELAFHKSVNMIVEYKEPAPAAEYNPNHH